MISVSERPGLMCGNTHTHTYIYIYIYTHTLYSPDSESYWGSYFKYRKRCLCALWMLLLWSLGAGAAAGRCCRMCGCVHFGTWLLLPLQSAAENAAAMCLWSSALWRLGAGAVGGSCRVQLQCAAPQKSLAMYPGVIPQLGPPR